MSRGAFARLCLAGVISATACAPRPADHVVERLEVIATVLVDGSVQVEERLTVRSGPVPMTTFRRQTPVWRHDGVFDINASMDGKTFAPGEGPGRAQVARGPALDVRWTFPPVSESRHLFILTYRAAGAVAVSGIRGTLSWRLLPGRREWLVEQARVKIDLPDGAVRLQDPWVDEAGWAVAATANGLEASRAGIGRDEAATPGLEFTIDHMAAAEPAWQYHARRAMDLMPAFVSAGLFLVVVAAGILLMLRLKFPAWRLRPDAPAFADPQAPPALALAIRRGRPRGDTQEIAAARSSIEAQAIPRGVKPPTLPAHEALVLDELWFAAGDANWARSRRRAWRRRFRRALERDLVAAGFVDDERVRAARDLHVAGVVVIVFAAVSWAVVHWLFGHLGRWPLAVPAGALVSGVMFVLAARQFPILSGTGVRARMLYSARVRDGRV